MATRHFRDSLVKKKRSELCHKSCSNTAAWLRLNFSVGDSGHAGDSNTLIVLSGVNFRHARHSES